MNRVPAIHPSEHLAEELRTNTSTPERNKIEERLAMPMNETILMSSDLTFLTNEPFVTVSMFS
ncbi:MAG: hypothetical protein ACRD1R_11560 [Acidobacteriota bacterium]